MVELLIGIAIFSVVAILFVVVVLTNSRLFSDQKTNIHLATQNRLALDEMTNQVRESQSIIADCDSQLSNCPAGEMSNSLQLILATWPLDSDGNPYQDDEICGFDYIVYKRGIDTTQLIKQIFPDSTSSRQLDDTGKIIASNVIDLSFAYDGDPFHPNPYEATEVTITLENEESSVHKTHNYAQDTKVTLRNKGGVPTANIFPYAAHADAGDIEFTAGQITGDVRSNSNILTAGSPNPEETLIDGNAWATGTSIPDTNISGTNTEGATTEPLPSIDVEYWKNEASCNNDPICINSGNLTIEDSTSLGPQKIEGNLTLDTDDVLTVTGPLWVEGNIILASGTIEPDISLGSEGTIIIMDGTFINWDEAKVHDNSTTPTKGFLLFYYTGTGTLRFPTKNPGDVVALALAPNGTIEIYGNNEPVIGAFAANRIAIGAGSQIEYDPDANFARFQTGSASSSCTP